MNTVTTLKRQVEGLITRLWRAQPDTRNAPIPEPKFGIFPRWLFSGVIK